MKIYDVVVRVDFGSSWTGFVYSFFEKYTIIYGKIPGVFVDNKVPTEIILDDNNDVIKFRVGCVKFSKIETLNSEHYFKRIKKELYENKKYIISKNLVK